MKAEKPTQVPVESYLELLKELAESEAKIKTLEQLLSQETKLMHDFRDERDEALKKFPEDVWLSKKKVLELLEGKPKKDKT